MNIANILLSLLEVKAIMEKWFSYIVTYSLFNIVMAWPQEESDPAKVDLCLCSFRTLMQMWISTFSTRIQTWLKISIFWIDIG